MTPVKRVLISGVSLDQVQAAAALLGGSGQAQVAGVALLDKAEASVHEIQPEIVLVIAQSRTIALSQIVGRLSQWTRVLVCAPFKDDEAADLLLAGASGVLQSEPATEELAAMIQCTEEVVCSDQVRFELFNRLSKLRAARTSDHCIISTDLSFQEVSILQLLGAGLSNKQIARQSNLSVHTVKNHVHCILKRLGVQNRIQAAVYFQSNPGA